MYEVTVEDTFAAGHYLRNYKGKCENPHGHNYKIRVTLAGAELDKAGLLLDFKDLKDVMKHAIDRLDHPMVHFHADHGNLQIAPGRIDACRPAVHLRASDRMQPALLLVRQRVQFLRWAKDDAARSAQRSRPAESDRRTGRDHRRRAHVARARSHPPNGATSGSRLSGVARDERRTSPGAGPGTSYQDRRREVSALRRTKHLRTRESGSAPAARRSQVRLHRPHRLRICPRLRFESRAGRARSRHFIFARVRKGRFRRARYFALLARSARARPMDP